MEDKSQILYQKLFEKGLYSKTYDDFITQFSDDTKRATLHNTLVGKGMYSKTYDEFNDQFFAPLVLKKKEPAVEDFLPTAENFQKASEEDLKKSKPLSQAPQPSPSVKFEDTLLDTPTVSSAVKTATTKKSYIDQQIEGRRTDIIKEIDAFGKELESEYKEKSKKEGANTKTLKEEMAKKEEAFLATKQKEFEKHIDDLYSPDNYEHLGKEDVAQLKKQVDYIISQPMAFTEKDKALGMLKEQFMSKLAGMPGEYTIPIQKELNDLVTRNALINKEGNVSMFGWKKEAAQKISDIDTNIQGLTRDFQSKYPGFNVSLPLAAQSFAMKEGEKQPTFKEYNNFLGEMRLLSMSKDKLSRVLQMPEVGNFATEFKKQGIDYLATLATLGFSDLAKAAEDTETSKRYVAGKKLTAGEEAAFATKGIFDAAAGTIKETPGMKLGAVVAEGIPFIEQMALMGAGGINLGSATMKQILKKAGVSALSKKGLGIVGKEAAKLIGTATAVSTVLPLSWERQQRGLAGIQKMDDQGNWVVDPTTVEKWWEATVKGLATGATETATEMVGGYLGEFGGVFNKIAKLTGANIRMPNGLTMFMKAAKVQGAPTEILEELINIPLQAPIGDQPLSEVSWKDIWDTVWTTAGFTTILGSGAVIGTPWKAIQRNRNYNVVTMFGRDKVAAVRDAILNHDQIAWEKAMLDAGMTFKSDVQGMETGKALQQLADYSKSLASEAVMRSEGIIKPEDKDDEMLAAVAGEQKTETDDNKNIAGIPGSVPQGETLKQAGPIEGRSPQEVSDNRVLQKEEEITVERGEEGEVMTMAAPTKAPPAAEVKQQVAAEIDRLNKLSKGQQVVAVENMNFPEDADPRAVSAFKKIPKMVGIHYPGDARSYVNVDNITSIEEARAVWLHEAGVHGGIERLFDTREAYDATMAQVVRSVGGENAILKSIGKAGGSPAYYKGKSKSMMGEEYLAFLSNKIITDPNLQAEKVLSPEELTIWQKFVKALRDAVDKFMGTPLKLTDADIANLVIDATKVAMGEKGAGAAFRGVKKGEVKAMVAGEQKETQIFTAPHRQSAAQNLSDPAPFDDPAYKGLLTTLENISKAMGFSAQVAKKYMGLWAEAGAVSFEGSAMVSIPTTDPKMVNLFSALAGALAFETQNSVMRVRYEVGAEGKMHIFEFKDTATADALVNDIREMLGNPEYKDAGMGQGASFAISEKKLYIGIAKEEEFDKFREIISKYKDGITDTQIADAEISFFGEADYEGVLGEYRAEAEGRDGGTGRNDLDNFVTQALGKLRGKQPEVAKKAPPEPSPLAGKIKDIIQKRIDTAYGIGMGEGKLVGEIEGRKAERKEQKAETKAEKRAERKIYQETSKAINTILKEADFKNNLTDFQSRTLVNAARRVVDDKTLKDFFEVVDRVVENREYKAQFDNAKSLQKDIRKRTRDGKNAYGATVQKVWDFASLPIRHEDFSLDDLKEYNRIAELLLRGRVPAEGAVEVKRYVPPEITATKSTGIFRNIKDIKDKEGFDTVLEALRGIEITSLANYRRVLRLAGEIKTRLDEMEELSDESIEEMYEELDAFTTALDERSTEIAEELEEEKSYLIDRAEGLKSLVDLSRIEYDQMREEVVRFMNLKKVDLMRMSPKQINLYFEIMDGLTWGGFVNKELPQFMDAIGQIEMETIWPKVQDKLEGEEFSKRRTLYDKLVKMNLGFLARFMEPLMVDDNTYLSNYISLRNLGSVDEKVLGMHREQSAKVERPTYEKYILPIIRAIQGAERATTIAINKYWNIAHKMSQTNRNLAGILMVEQDFRSNPIVIEEGENKGEYTWDTLPAAEKLDLTRWALGKSDVAKIDLKELRKYRDELVMDKDGNVDIEASIKKLSVKDKNFAKLMATAREIFDAHKGKARFAAEMRGVIFGDEGPNYTPRIVRQENVGRGDSGYSIEHIDKMFSPFAAIRKRAKATYERTHGRYVVEYSLDNIVGMHIMDVNRDFYLSRPLGIANRSLRHMGAVSTNKDMRLFTNALRSAVADRVKVEFSESSMRWLSKLISWRRMLALVSIQRPAMELTANAVRYAIVNPAMMFDSVKFSDARWRNVIDHMSSPLSLKLSRWAPEGVTGVSIEDVRNRNDQNAGMADIFKDTQKSWAERTGEWFYTFADTSMGRIVYAHEFNVAFKSKTGKGFDLKAFTEDPAYAKEHNKDMAYADAMAFAMMEELYNSQSWITAPSKVKFIPGVMDKSVLASKKGGWAKVFGYMQSFNFNETDQTLKYIQTILRPGMGPQAKTEAARKIAAFAVSNYIYMATMGAAARAISAAIASSLDGEDDDLWADVWAGLADYMAPKSQAKLLVGSLITLGMGRYGGVARELTSLAWGGLQYLFPDSAFVKSLISGTQMTMYVQPVDFSRRYRPDQMMDKLGGVAGDIAAEMTRMGMNVADIIKKVNEEGLSALSPDEREFWVLMSAFNQTAALIAPNFMSPLAERAIKAKTYDLTADYSVEPDIKLRTLQWGDKKIDIYNQYKIEPHRGVAGNKIVVVSTGNREGNEVLITDTEKKKYQSLAKEKFNDYVAKYVSNNAQRIGNESFGTLTPAMTDRVQGDVNKLWTKAKAQAKYEMYEYPGLKTGSGYARIKRYGAIPQPISRVERDDKNILEANVPLVKKINSDYLKLYIEMFKEKYPTDSDVSRAQREGRFDKEVSELSSSAKEAVTVGL